MKKGGKRRGTEGDTIERNKKKKKGERMYCSDFLHPLRFL